METLEFETVKAIVNEELYTKIKLIVESEYNHESVVRNTGDKEIVFKDRAKAIELVKQHILDFCAEKGLDKASVLASIYILLDEEAKRNPMFLVEFQEVGKVVKGLPEEEEK